MSVNRYSSRVTLARPQSGTDDGPPNYQVPTQSSLKIMNALFWYAAPWNELPIELSERRQIASFTFTSYHIW